MSPSTLITDLLGRDVTALFFKRGSEGGEVAQVQDYILYTFSARAAGCQEPCWGQVGTITFKTGAPRAPHCEDAPGGEGTACGFTVSKQVNCICLKPVDPPPAPGPLPTPCPC